MALQGTPYTLPLVASLIVAVGLGSYSARVWRRDGQRLALPFATLMAASSVWVLATIVQVTVVGLSAKVTAVYVANVATVFVGPAWLWFALVYADAESWLTRERVLGLAVEPVVVVAATVTNGAHWLMWNSVAVTETTPTYLVRPTGPLWSAHALYSYVLVVIGAYLIVRTSIGGQRTYRVQGALTTLGAFVALLGNATFFLGVGPEHVNLTPVVVTVSGLCFAVGIFRYRVLDLVPVARETVVDRMAEGYVVLDEDDRIVDLNPAASRLAGLSEDAAVGSRFSEVVPEAASLLETSDDASGTDPVDDAPAGSDLVFETEAGRRYVEASVSTLGDGPGGGGRAMVFRDVTERREVELRYQRLIENASDIVTVLDPDGRITYQSPSVERVLGYEADEMVGDTVFEYIHPDDRDRIVEEFTAGLEEGGYVTRLEYRFRHGDGSWRTLESLGQNLLDDPVVDGVLVNSRDVTERREKERELEAANERLERFASVVSHDLRNPLTVAGGHLELARAGDESALDEVEAAHDRMERIIENVLALAREGETVEDPRQVDVETVARRAWENVETETATLVVEGSGLVTADPERLQRALENCVRNALEHAVPDDGSTADLTITVGVEDGDLFVADDGVGVDDDDLDDLFEEGYTTGGGTGLGLAIVRSTAEAHGWSVGAEGSEAGGLRVVFEGVETG